MKKKILSVLLIMAMINIMPLSAFASDVTHSPILIAKAKSVDSNVIEISWLHFQDANRYVIYGNKCGKSMKKLKAVSCDGTTSNTSVRIKKIGKKKLKKHEVYRFYVLAKKDGVNLSKSNKLTVVSGKTTGDNKKYSNATKINIVHKQVNLERENIASAVIIADISSTIYKNKKHLPTKYGAKYRYITDNPNVLSINSEGLMQVKSSAPIGSVATVIVQELNGVYNTFDVKVVNAEAPEQKTIIVHDGYYPGQYVSSATIENATSNILSRIDTKYQMAINSITGIDAASMAQKTALDAERIDRRNMVTNLKEYISYTPNVYAYDAFLNEINKIYNADCGVTLIYNDLLQEMLNNM